MRGTTHLVVAQLDTDNLHFSVEEPEPGYILIQGNEHDPVVYSSLVDKMLDKKVERYILIFGVFINKNSSFVELFLNELERKDLPTPVERPRISVFSVEDINKHLQENISGGIMYYNQIIGVDVLEWIGAECKIPIIYIDDLPSIEEYVPFIRIREESVERIRKGNPTLFIHVIVRE